MNIILLSIPNTGYAGQAGWMSEPTNEILSRLENVFKGVERFMARN